MAITLGELCGGNETAEIIDKYIDSWFVQELLFITIVQKMWEKLASILLCLLIVK